MGITLTVRRLLVAAPAQAAKSTVSDTLASPGALPRPSTNPTAPAACVSLSGVAEFERRRISERTKDALMAARARGVKLGVAGAKNLRPNVEGRQRAANDHAERLRSILLGFQQQLTRAAMVAQLNTLGIPAPAGGAWHRTTLARVMVRLNERIQA